MHCEWLGLTETQFLEEVNPMMLPIAARLIINVVVFSWTERPCRRARC